MPEDAEPGPIFSVALQIPRFGEHVSVVLRIAQLQHAALFQIAEAADALALLSGLVQGGQKKRGKNGNDRNNN